jgi:hypothetical protein
MRLLLLIISVGTLIMLGRFYSASMEQDSHTEKVNATPQSSISPDSELSQFKSASHQSLSSRFDKGSNGTVEMTDSNAGSTFQAGMFADRESGHPKTEPGADKTSTSTLPVNAKNVRRLSRAYYELPPEAAELLEKFFGLDSDCLVETKVIGKKTDPMVTFEVTTDDATQKSLGNFLLSVYPVDKNPLADNFPDDEATKVAVRSKDHTFQLSDTIDLDAILQ